MRRIGVVGFLLLMIVSWNARPAGAGSGCCVCSQCDSGPPECVLPSISCDVTCAQAGCTQFAAGFDKECTLLPACGAASASAPAPAAGGLALGLTAASLAALGVQRLFRRRA